MNYLRISNNYLVFNGKKNFSAAISSLGLQSLKSWMIENGIVWRDMAISADAQKALDSIRLCQTLHCNRHLNSGERFCSFECGAYAGAVKATSPFYCTANPLNHILARPKHIFHKGAG